MDKRIHILLAEGYPIMREGLRAMLSQEPELDIVAETDDGREVVDLVRQFDPDVLVIDLLLPRRRVPDILHELTRERARCRTLILSLDATEALVRSALRAGASGYLLKSAYRDELKSAIQAVHAGLRYLSASLRSQPVPAPPVSPPAAPPSPDPLTKLDAAERQMLVLMAEGRSNVEIAERRGLPVRQVERLRGEIMSRLGLPSQTALVRFAMRRGLIPELS